MASEFTGCAMIAAAPNFELKRGPRNGLPFARPAETFEIIGRALETGSRQKFLGQIVRNGFFVIDGRPRVRHPLGLLSNTYAEP